MAHYLVAHVKVNNDSWMPAYAEKVHDIVHRHGGKYLTRSASITTLEGTAPGFDMMALIEFPSEKAMMSFVEDPEYAPFAASRQEGTDSQLFGIDQSDAAGTIPYLNEPD